jgi:hypothetical protein
MKDFILLKRKDKKPYFCFILYDLDELMVELTVDLFVEANI